MKPIITCKDCGLEKEHWAHGLCRRCYRNEWNKRNPEKMRQYNAKQIATNKKNRSKVYKRWVEKNRERRNETKRKSYARHKEHNNAKNREWRIENREHHIASAVQWQKDNPEKFKENARRANQRRRARLAGATYDLTKEEWNKIKHDFDNRCAYCSKECNLTQDHIIPVSKGGGYTADNIIPACKSCNSSRQSMSVQDFIEYKKSIGHPLKLHPELLARLESLANNS